MRSILFALLIATGGCSGSRGPTEPQNVAVLAPGGPWGVTGSSARGEVLAEMRCSSCHAVGRSGPSPMTAAPPFRGLAQRYPVADLQEALAEGLVTAHPAMPQVEMEADDIADLIAYLDSVGSPNGPPP